MDQIRIRPATTEDSPHILRHRRAMYADMDRADAAALDRMQLAAEAHLSGALRDGSYRGWLAEASPEQPYARRAVVHNVYTDHGFRRRGIARRLMETMLEWCGAEGFAAVALHASDDGRALCLSMGFRPTNETRPTFPKSGVPGQ